MKKIFILSLFLGVVCLLNGQNTTKTMLKLPDTGQTSDYTPTFGEDSDYNINAPFFIKNNNGTITDTITGLMWQQTDGGEMSIEKARIYADTLTLTGFTDWRLPTAHEGFSILNMDKLNPALDIAFFTNTGAEYWWTSDVRFDDATKIWATNSGGGIGAHPKTETIGAGGTKKFHARAVRDVKIPQTVVHFKDNGDGTITDNVTNLIWQKTPSTDTLTWEQALNYAANLVFAGKSDWRLPNIKELTSINDESHNAPSINLTFFPTLKSNRYWSSTSQKNVSVNAWFNDFQNFGITSYFAKTKGYNVICVRGGTGLTSVKDEFNSELANVQIYPNPTASDITIHFKNMDTNAIKRLQISNEMGQVVLTEQIPSTIQAYRFQTSQLKNGIYFMSIFKGNTIKTVKILVNK